MHSDPSTFRNRPPPPEISASACRAESAGAVFVLLQLQTHVATREAAVTGAPFLACSRLANAALKIRERITRSLLVIMWMNRLAVNFGFQRTRHMG